MRCSAARAAGRVCDDTAVGALTQLLEDDDAGVRWGAAEALGNLGAAAATALEPLVVLLEDEEEDPRSAALQTLGKLVKAKAIPSEALVDPFSQLLADDEWTVRRAAAEALGIGGCVPELVQVVQLVGVQKCELCSGPWKVRGWGCTGDHPPAARGAQRQPLPRATGRCGGLDPDRGSSSPTHARCKR